MYCENHDENPLEHISLMKAGYLFDYGEQLHVGCFDSSAIVCLHLSFAWLFWLGPPLSGPLGLRIVTFGKID